jgi:hypothetical protein
LARVWCLIYVDAKSAVAQRDALARSLYAIATTWITEQINNKLCKDDKEWKNFIAVFDPPGLYGRDSWAEANDFWRLLTNYGNTLLSEFISKKMFDESESKLFEEQGLGFVPRVFSASKTALELFDDSSSVRVGGGLFSFFDSLILDTQKVEHPSSEQVSYNLFIYPGSRISDKRVCFLFRLYLSEIDTQCVWSPT